MEKPTDILQDLELRITKDTILFFDMDGTLVDTNFANYLSYKKAIQSVKPTNTDIPFNPTERFNRSLLKRVVPNLTESDEEKIIQQKEECYEEHLPQTKLNKLVVEILIKYSKTNKTVLVSNCREDRALMTLNYHGLTDKFCKFFFRQFIDDNRKINKFQNAIQSLGVSPKFLIVFENEEREIADAKEAGISVNNILSI